MPEVTYRRAHHVVSELQRTQAGAQALENNDYKEFGRLMYQSHESLQKFFEVSCEELDQLVELARSVDGVYGSRMTGGGFGKRLCLIDCYNPFILGGCTVTLVKKSAVKKCIETIDKGYKGEASFYVFEPSDGDRPIDIKTSQK